MRSRHVALLKCRAGDHAFEKLGYGTSYGGHSEHTERCGRCGLTENVIGGKTYEPPYWRVTRRVIREGDFSDLESLGV